MYIWLFSRTFHLVRTLVINVLTQMKHILKKDLFFKLSEEALWHWRISGILDSSPWEFTPGQNDLTRVRLARENSSCRTGASEILFRSEVSALRSVGSQSGCKSNRDPFTSLSEHCYALLRDSGGFMQLNVFLLNVHFKDFVIFPHTWHFGKWL